MSLRVKIGKNAKKVLDRFDIKERQRVLDKVRDLRDWIEGTNINVDVKKLKGKWEGYYRLRVGKVRILMDVDVEEEIIKICDIGFRGDVYKY